MPLLAALSIPRPQRNALRLLLIALALFILSTVAACKEFRYFAWGKTAHAKIEKGEAWIDGAAQMLRIHYSFPDGELGVRQEEDEIPVGWAKGDDEVIPGDGTVTIQFLGGSPHNSRLKGHGHIWLIFPALLSLAALTYFTFRYWSARQQTPQPQL